MALPMDEQRILEEMERMLAADDPRLAAKLAAFGQPGVTQVLRTRRARAVLSIMMLGIIACAAAVIYMVDALHLSDSQLTQHDMRTSQPVASQPAAPAPAHANVPVTGAPRCVLMVKLGQCTIWSSSGISTTKAGLTPTSSDHTAQASSQSVATRHATSHSVKR
jgi:hypothetical protein